MGQHPEAAGQRVVSVERAVIPVDDLDAAIARFEADGYRLATISPADDPRTADMDGPDRAVRLDVTATQAAVITVEPQPFRIPELVPELVISRAVDAQHGAGRAGMQYRDLIPGRLGGRFIASHIAIPQGGPVPDYVHHHAIRFQLIFCNAGWVKVVYEDQGEPFVMHPGDCVIQPPHIRHRVLESSDGLEVVEIGCPAEHDTHRDHDLELPNESVDPSRVWEGQRFVRHVDGDHEWEPWRQPGWIASPSASPRPLTAWPRLAYSEPKGMLPVSSSATRASSSSSSCARARSRSSTPQVRRRFSQVTRSLFRPAMRIGWLPHRPNCLRSPFRAKQLGGAQASTR